MCTCTHLHMHKNRASPPAYIPLYPSLTPPTPFLDDKVKDAVIDLYSTAQMTLSSAALKGSSDLSGNWPICRLLKQLCHLLNAK